MRFLSSIFLFLFFSLFTLSPATASGSSTRLHHASGYPEAWHMLEPVPDQHPVPIALPIKLNNVPLLATLLESISDPQSYRYARYLSFAEVNAITANPTATEAVKRYLESIGATNIDTTLTGDYVRATLTAAQARDHLSAQVNFFASNRDPNVKIAKAPAYIVPKEIAEHVDFIGYISHFPTRLGRVRSYASTNSSINNFGNTFPSLINKYYNIDSNTVASSTVSQSCFESGQWISNTDLNQFQRQYGLPKQDLTKIIGPNFPNNCGDPNNCAESTLDFEYMMAIAQAPTWYIAVDASDQQPFLDYASTLSNEPNAPLVNSISYGEVEQQADPSVVQRFNAEAQKLGLRGITLVAASGDDGVANFPAREDLRQCGFYPSYPASIPYITAVGATQGPESGGVEIAETSNSQGLITTGGGFSTVFPTPSYQTAAVEAYLNSSVELPPSSQFNSKGRGYPDVALIGHNYETVDGGKNIVVSGTSASAPVFAALLTLINNARIALGKGPVGFVNPALYQIAATNPSIFKDVTKGKNNCVAGDGTKCCKYGFQAAKGWDPTTGLGSVDFVALKKAFVALP